MIREIYENELDQLLQLYLYLHEDTVPQDTEHLRETWSTILRDSNHHIIVYEVDGKLVYLRLCDRPQPHAQHPALCPH